LPTIRTDSPAAWAVMGGPAESAAASATSTPAQMEVTVPDNRDRREVGISDIR